MWASTARLIRVNYSLFCADDISKDAYPCLPDGCIDFQGKASVNEVRHLPAARERVQVIHSWLVELIMENQWLETGKQVKGTNHVFDCVSSAMLAYQNCRCARTLTICLQPPLPILLA